MAAELGVVFGDGDALVDELVMQLALAEMERDQLRVELDEKRREVAHLRVELREEAA